MKIIYFSIVILLSISLYGAGPEDCELPKVEKSKILEPQKDGGCKLGNTSEDLVTCLLNAKNKDEEKLCHQKNKKQDLIKKDDKILPTEVKKTPLDIKTKDNKKEKVIKTVKENKKIKKN